MTRARVPLAKPRRVAFFYALSRGLPYPAAQRLLAAARDGRMLPARENFRSLELASVMTTFPVSPLQRPRR
jgi:hypothetical protein